MNLLSKFCIAVSATRKWNCVAVGVICRGVHRAVPGMPGNHLNCFDLGPRKLSERRTEGAENCMHCTAASAGAINVVSVCAPAGRRKIY